eukprot:5171825-Prymnesium_polylepis.2
MVQERAIAFYENLPFPTSIPWRSFTFGLIPANMSLEHRYSLAEGNVDTSRQWEASALLRQYENFRVLHAASRLGRRAFCESLSLEYNAKGVADAMLSEVFASQAVRTHGQILRLGVRSATRLPTAPLTTDTGRMAGWGLSVRTRRASSKKSKGKATASTKAGAALRQRTTKAGTPGHAPGSARRR